MHKRPRCELRNVGLDINRMIKITSETLIQEGMDQEADQFMEEINQAKSLSGVFGAINRYVDTSSDLLEYLEARKADRNNNS